MAYTNLEDKKAYDREWRRRQRAGKPTAHKPVTPQGSKRDKVIDYKSTHCCVACGKFDHPSSMDFHHKDPQQKLFEINAATQKKGRTLEEIFDEIEKCHLLCASCHRKLHSNALCIIGDALVFDRTLQV